MPVQVQCSDLVKRFKNKFAYVDDDGQTVAPVETEEQPTPSVRSERYRLNEKGGGYYDVISEDDNKIINEKGLRLDDAKKLVEDLGGALVESDDVNADGEAKD